MLPVRYIESIVGFAGKSNERMEKTVKKNTVPTHEPHTGVNISTKPATPSSDR